MPPPLNANGLLDRYLGVNRPEVDPLALAIKEGPNVQDERQHVEHREINKRFRVAQSDPVCRVSEPRDRGAATDERQVPHSPNFPSRISDTGNISDWFGTLARAKVAVNQEF